MIEGLHQSGMIFNLVFFIAVSSVLVQGTTLPAIARGLHLTVPGRAKKRSGNDLEWIDPVMSVREEILLPAHAPAPVIEPIVYVGAVPVLIDKARDDYGPDLTSLQSAITSKTKAVMAVHLLGLPCDMESIGRIAAEHGVPVVEDSSQAQGAMYRGDPCGAPAGVPGSLHSATVNELSRLPRMFPARSGACIVDPPRSDSSSSKASP